MTFCRRLFFLGAVALAFFVADVRAAEQGRNLKLHFISGSKEYESEKSLKKFKDQLEQNFNVDITASWASDGATNLDNLEKLAAADCLVVFARRLKLGEDQMALIRRHWNAGKPVIGIRTAGHAFGADDNAIFDRRVLGGNYQGHHRDEQVQVIATEAGKTHPVLAGVGRIESKKLYKAGPLADDTVVLQVGDIEKANHPVTMVHSYEGGRMFYTSLGVQADFANANFLRLLENAIFWTCKTKRESIAKGN